LFNRDVNGLERRRRTIGQLANNELERVRKDTTLN